jgi:hypothetical protein
MEEEQQNRDDTWLVVDDTTIYELDVNCYQCMTPKERRQAGLENTDENYYKK